ncbi:hypothetical protein Aperf_G00000098838 [Anoplocephala perfoliata]
MGLYCGLLWFMVVLSSFCFCPMKLNHALLVVEVKGQLLLKRFPQVKAFVEKIDNYPNIRFISKSGHSPTAVLLNDEDGVPQETFSIESWDTDTIEEFFRERLL